MSTEAGSSRLAEDALMRHSRAYRKLVGTAFDSSDDANIDRFSGALKQTQTLPLSTPFSAGVSPFLAIWHYRLQRFAKDQ